MGETVTTQQEPRCIDCGQSLALEPWQIEWVVKHGNPVPRPPCPRWPSGLHRVADPATRG